VVDKPKRTGRQYGSLVTSWISCANMSMTSQVAIYCQIKTNNDCFLIVSRQVLRCLHEWICCDWLAFYSTSG
jgi:hypothetical protein